MSGSDGDGVEPIGGEFAGGFDPGWFAAELAHAEAIGQPVPLFSERIQDLDWSRARAIARARDDLRARAGERRVGYKLGWTSAAMRAALGIDRPNWGTLWASQRVDARLDVAGLHHPKVEPELVAEIGRDGDPFRWGLGLEIVNPRFPSYRFHWLDNTADNSSGARIAFGPLVGLDDDPSDVRVEFTLVADDGEHRVDGGGDSVTGGPHSAVEWLSGQLGAEGSQLSPGELVFTGGLTAPFEVRPGQHYALTSPTHPQLGTVVLDIIEIDSPSDGATSTEA